MSGAPLPMLGIDLGGTKIEAALLAPDGAALDWLLLRTAAI